MDVLNSVSETALITLRARAIESQKQNAVLKDDIGLECLRRLQNLLPKETQDRLLNRKLPSILTRHIALRARKYDDYARTFIQKTPQGMVVSLGCGFDTRYWRLFDKPWKYVEIDLPEVIEAKREVLGDLAQYLMIGCSVVTEEWIQKILSIQREHVMFIAEGLFMYLPEEQVVSIFSRLSESFIKSQIALEVVTDKFTRGIGKRLLKYRMQYSLKVGAEASFSFGIKNAKDIEAYGKNIKVVDEWSYFEDSDIEPRFFRIFRNFRPLSRSQWTILATIG